MYLFSILYLKSIDACEDDGYLENESECVTSLRVRVSESVLVKLKTLDGHECDLRSYDCTGVGERSQKSSSNPI